MGVAAGGQAEQRMNRMAAVFDGAIGGGRHA